MIQHMSLMPHCWTGILYYFFLFFIHINPSIQDLLNRHVLNHRDFPCIQCGLVFYQQALLVKHMNTITHGGERKFGKF